MKKRKTYTARQVRRILGRDAIRLIARELSIVINGDGISEDEGIGSLVARTMKNAKPLPRGMGH